MIETCRNQVELVEIMAIETDSSAKITVTSTVILREFWNHVALSHHVQVWLSNIPKKKKKIGLSPGFCKKTIWNDGQSEIRKLQNIDVHVTGYLT